ncbi:unnamed protein product [Thlaspi arvense]|uniref:Glucose-methanol-choline oxidoreductase N-terminal domain-containing protein n=1 Tax=Thlaspi arvense TaxID=13288 RepID=A0AAU9SP42_THLAR|nr:unnamed protein product [Thlaspi arvense]
MVFIFHGSCYSDEAGRYTFMKDATLAPTYASFDYIIIGGGTSATLSQNASVLLLERGGSPYDNPTAMDIGNFDGYVEEAEWEIDEEWVEKKLVFEPRLMGWQTAFVDGLLEAGLSPYNGFTYDHIYGTKIGGTIIDGAEYANPNNLVVYLHASVHKILFTTTGSGINVDSDILQQG